MAPSPILQALRSGSGRAPLTRLPADLRQHAKPLNERPAGSLDRRDIVELLAEISSRSGGVTANRVRSSLSVIWAWAIMEGRQDHNPVAMTRKPAAEASRDQVLTDAELAVIWGRPAAGPTTIGLCDRSC